MNRISLFTAFCWALSASLACSQDHGFPALNTVGRYLGIGWSHHTYHSQVDGRFPAITNRHPACAYPSSALTSIYSADYRNYPPQSAPHSTPAGFWQAPRVIEPVNLDSLPHNSILESDSKSRKAGPKEPKESKDPKQTAEELATPEELLPPKLKDPPKPTEPPPSWLKPYLEDEKAKSKGSDLIELDPSPSDKTTAAPNFNRYRR